MSGPSGFSSDPHDDFADALRDAGFRLDGPPIMDGTRQRCAVEGDRGTTKSGTYKGFLDGRPAGTFTNFKDVTRSGNWKARADRTKQAPTEADREDARRIVEAEKAKRELRQETTQEGVTRYCRQAWDGALPAPPTHPYLLKKGYSGEGLRMRAGCLLVPMHDDATGELVNLQSIGPDGVKLFALGVKGGRIAGTHLLIGRAPRAGEWLLITEGWATGQAVHAATGHAVAVAFAKTNFVTIAQAYQDRVEGIRIAFAGDNDHHHPRRDPPLPNVGKVAAEAAAAEVDGIAVLPDFQPEDSGTDWDDHTRLHGIEATRAAILAKLAGEALAYRSHYPRATKLGREASLRLKRIVVAFLNRVERWIDVQTWIRTEAARTVFDVQQDMEEKITAKLLKAGATPENAAAEAAERAAKSAQGVATRKARSEAARCFGKKVAAKTLDPLQVKGAAGSGKSSLFAAEYVRRPKLWGLNINFHVPDLDLAADYARGVRQVIAQAKIEGKRLYTPEGNEPRVLTVSGRQAEGNCHKDRKPLVEAAQRKGVDSIMSTVCHTKSKDGEMESFCPFHGWCSDEAYLFQFKDQRPALRILTHKRIIMNQPEEAKLPPADLVIIDESVIETMTGRARIDPAWLSDPATYSSFEGEEYRIQEAVDIGTAVAKRLAEGGNFLRNIKNDCIEMLKKAPGAKLLDPVKLLGEPEKLLKLAAAAAKAGYDKARPKIYAGLETGKAMEVLQKYTKHNGNMVKELLKQLAEDIPHGRVTSPTVEWDAEHMVTLEDGTTAKHPMIYHHFLNPTAQVSKSVPLLLLDADAYLKANQRFFGNKLRELTVPAVRHAHVTQIYDHPIAKSSLVYTNAEGKDQALRDKITALIKRKAKEDQTLAVVPLDLRRELTKEDEQRVSDYAHFEGAQLTHFPRFKGKDNWKHFDTIICVSREQLPPLEAERKARAIFGNDLTVRLDLPGEYEWQMRRHDMRHGKSDPVRVQVHRDPHVQALLEIMRECMIGQAVDRLRLVHRDPAKPAEVVVLCNLPIPGLVVDRLLSLEDVLAGGTVWERALAQVPGGVLPLIPSWLINNLSGIDRRERFWKAESANAAKGRAVLNGLERESATHRKVQTGYIGFTSRTALFLAEFRQKNVKFSKCLVFYNVSVSDIEAHIRNELAKLPDIDSVAEVRIPDKARVLARLAAIAAAKVLQVVEQPQVAPVVPVPVPMPPEPVAVPVVPPVAVPAVVVPPPALVPVPVSVMVPGMAFTVMRKAVPPQVPGSVEGMPRMPWQPPIDEAAEAQRAEHRPWQAEWDAVAKAAREGRAE